MIGKEEIIETVSTEPRKFCADTIQSDWNYFM
jgi:hypothetical protein